MRGGWKQRVTESRGCGRDPWWGLLDNGNNQQRGAETSAHASGALACASPAHLRPDPADARGRGKGRRRGASASSRQGGANNTNTQERAVTSQCRRRERRCGAERRFQPKLVDRDRRACPRLAKHMTLSQWLRIKGWYEHRQAEHDRHSARQVGGVEGTGAAIGAFSNV